MSRWFRFYDDALNDPKILKLSDKSYRVWTQLLCAASKNDGMLPLFEDLAIMLRMKPEKLQPEIEKLITAGLIDHDDTGMYPHNWNARQFISDSSAERVKRHRQKRAERGMQSQWTVPKKLRQEIYTRDNFECVYCGCEDDLTLDHKTPESRGGTHDASNLQTACRKCNASKRDLTHDEYLSRNSDVTLLKRPQSTEQSTEQKEDSSLRSLPPKKRKIALPEDWQVSETGRAYAISRGMLSSKVLLEAERFKNHAIEKARLFAGERGIEAAWRNWATSPYQTAGPPGSKPQTLKETKQQGWHDARAKLKEFIFDGNGSSGDGSGSIDGLLPAITRQ